MSRARHMLCNVWCACFDWLEPFCFDPTRPGSTPSTRKGLPSWFTDRLGVVWLVAHNNRFYAWLDK